jgi:hypothetical protein
MVSHKDGTELVSIPVSGRALANFLVDLLGQRRSTERIFRGDRFTVDHNWLINLHLILDQRIVSQNEGQLVSFKANIYYDNGRISNVFTYDGFSAYRDISSDVCVGVEMSWMYLIKFPGKELPEKQEVNFAISVDEKYKERKLQQKYKFSEYVTLGADQQSIIRINISYSDYSWGEDILSQIARYVESSLRKPDFIARVVDVLQNFSVLPILAFALILFASYLETRFFSTARNIVGAAIDNGMQVSSAEISKKMDVILQGEKYLVFRTQLSFLFALVYSAVMLILIFTALGLRASSFIIMNDYSKGIIDVYRSRLNIIHFAIIVSLVVGIIASVFANKIYDLLKIGGIL